MAIPILRPIRRDSDSDQSGFGDGEWRDAGDHKRDRISFRSHGEFWWDSRDRVTVVSNTSITATTPAHAAGAVTVVVTNTDSQPHAI